MFFLVFHIKKFIGADYRCILIKSHLIVFVNMRW